MADGSRPLHVHALRATAKKAPAISATISHHVECASPPLFPPARPKTAVHLIRKTMTINHETATRAHTLLSQTYVQLPGVRTVEADPVQWPAALQARLHVRLLLAVQHAHLDQPVGLQAAGMRDQAGLLQHAERKALQIGGRLEGDRLVGGDRGAQLAELLGRQLVDGGAVTGDRLDLGDDGGQFGLQLCFGWALEFVDCGNGCKHLRLAPAGEKELRR